MINRATHQLRLLRHLVRMQRAGLPWLESLDMWRDSCSDARQKARARQLIERVRAGEGLSQALARGGWLAGAALALSEAGEASGTWGEQMGLWVAHADAQAKLSRQVRSALSYPLVVLALALAVIAGVMTWVLPVFEGLFAALQSPLPTSTQALLLTRRWLVSVTAPGLGAGLVLAALGSWTRTRPGGRLRLERWGWRLPLWGRWRHMHAESQWCALLARLLGAGLDWQRALTLVGPASGSEVMAEATHQVRQGAVAGRRAGRTVQRRDPPD